MIRKKEKKIRDRDEREIISQVKKKSIHKFFPFRRERMFFSYCGLNSHQMKCSFSRGNSNKGIKCGKLFPIRNNVEWRK
jgi:hypothetical protein